MMPLFNLQHSPIQQLTADRLEYKTFIEKPFDKTHARARAQSSSRDSQLKPNDPAFRAIPSIPVHL